MLRAWDEDLKDLRNEDIRHDVAYDNIHCAYAIFRPQGGYESKGCQVIAGFGKTKDGRRTAASGPWAKFDAVLYDQLNQDRFGYALIDARPLRATALKGAPTPAIALRYGSEGAAVTRLRQALVSAGHARARRDRDGLFLYETLKALIDWQARTPDAGGVDGVAGPQTLAKLGLSELVPS